MTTKDLTRAFGWNSTDSFLQQDVQEMMRVLLDKLEEKMKGTTVNSVVKSLFAGSVKSYIRCVNVEYESSREEDFYDIQLDVKGSNHIYESFRRYIAKEMLEGDNKYDAEVHGKQDAEKGVIFTKFPPVLTIHLKRFDFDLHRMCFAKIHDRLEFPAELNLDEFLDPTCREAGGGGEVIVPNDYLLHSVLVHSGDVNGGHYYAYIRPSESGYWERCTENIDPREGKWFKFDDEIVSKVSHVDALDNCFGRDKSSISGSISSAYMLVYIRKFEASSIMQSLAVADIPTSLRTRLDSEVEAKQFEVHENMMKMYNYNINYYLASDVASFNKFSMHEAVFDTDNPRTFPIVKSTTLLGIYFEFCKVLDINPSNMRLWVLNEPDLGDVRVECSFHEFIRVNSFDYQPFIQKRGSLAISLYFYVELLGNNENSNYFVENIRSIQVREQDWLEKVRNAIGNKRFNYDPAEGLGVGKQLESLRQRLPAGISNNDFENLKINYHNLCLYAKNIFERLVENRQDPKSSAIIFVRIFDQEKTIPSTLYKHYQADEVPDFPFYTTLYVSVNTDFSKVVESFRVSFLSNLPPEIALLWETASFLHIKKGFHIYRDDCDHLNISGNILCVEYPLVQGQFEEWFDQQRFTKEFILSPLSEFDARIVQSLAQHQLPSISDVETSQTSETPEKKDHIKIEILTRRSVRDLFILVANKLGMCFSK